MSFGVRATDERFLDLTRTYLGPFAVPPGDADDMQTYSADCGIERRLAGGGSVRGKLALYLETMCIYQGRSADEMLGRLISDARTTGTAHSNEFVRIRAGAVTMGDMCILLPSSPEPRLPTLVGLLLKAGCGHLGDESVKIDPVLRRVHGMPLPLLLDTGDVHLFPELSPDPSQPSQRRRRDATARPFDRRPVSVGEIGAELSRPSPIGAIVFPFLRPGERTRLEPIGRADALFRLTEAMLNLNVWGNRALILMRELLDSTPSVSQLVVGSLQESVAVLGESVLGSRR